MTRNQRALVPDLPVAMQPGVSRAVRCRARRTTRRSTCARRRTAPATASPTPGPRGTRRRWLAWSGSGPRRAAVTAARASLIRSGSDSDHRLATEDVRS